PSLPLARSFQIDLAGRSGVSAYKALLDAEKMIDKDEGFEIAVLVNNAGFGTYGPFEKTPLESELDMIDLNCVTLTGIAGLSLPYMTKGSILINTASLAAFLPLGNFSVYAATKAYALSFSESLAAEVADKGIKVCALCPGSVSTEFANVASNGARKEVLGGVSAQETVRHCIKAAKKGKTTALWAFKWKFTAFMSRFVGRYFGARWTYVHCPRPRK
ncbi:MAG: SDR family NAD(P)-dependent oxidoreductase, partial [Treponema sp.]|nr:SDR family NAD(P)-dependent oxidoreductase [Treponema sp.]